MGIRSIFSKPFAASIVRSRKNWTLNPVITQRDQFEYLLHKGRETAFGQEHGFAGIRNYSDFKKQVPIRDYESFSNFINRILEGENDVLWPGKPLYFAKTSGTTSGTKYIPLTKESTRM